MKEVHLEKETRVSCNIWEKTYSRQDSLERRMKSIHGEGKFHCAVCPSKFVRKDNLEWHMKTVHDKRFLYEVCQLKFGRKSNLIRHMQRMLANTYAVWSSTKHGEALKRF